MSTKALSTAKGRLPFGRPSSAVLEVSPLLFSLLGRGRQEPQAHTQAKVATGPCLLPNPNN